MKCKYFASLVEEMSANPAVTLASAKHFHGVPGTTTWTRVAGSVRFESSYPLHVGDYWASHYVPEWESSHDTSVRTGAYNVLCDNRVLAITEGSNIDCGIISFSPVMSTVIRY